MLSGAISMVVKTAQKVKLNAVFLASGNRKQLSQTAEEKNWPWSFKVLSLASGNLWAKLAEFACHSHKTNVNEQHTNRVYVGPQNCPGQDEEPPLSITQLTDISLCIHWSSPVIWKPNYLCQNNLENICLCKRLHQQRFIWQGIAFFPPITNKSLFWIG